MIRAGTLRHPIKIESNQTTINDYNEPVEQWTTLHTTRANIKPLKGNENFISDQIHAETTHLITMRYLKPLDTSMRINFNGRFFDILSIINIEEKNRALQILAKEQS